MNTEWDAPTRRTAALILGLIILFTIYLSRSVLTFIIIAALIAFFLIPVVSFLNKKLHIPKWLAVLLAYILLFLVILLVPVILIPAIFDAFGDIQIDVVKLTDDTLKWANSTLQAYRIISIWEIEYDLSSIIDPTLEIINESDPSRLIPSFETIIASIPSTLEFTWDVASNVVGTVTSSVLAIILTLLYSLYLTVDGDKFIKSFIKLAPKVYRSEVTELYRRIRTIWSAYFRGQFTLALIIGTVTWIVGMIIGLPGALALGVMAGILEILPNLGPILAAIPALLIAIVQGSTTLPVSNLTFVLIVLGAYILIQQLENNLIVPKILGEAVELHSLTVMIGVVVGATVGGILGALLAAPIIASGRVIMAYMYAKILQEDPFPIKEKETEKPPSFLNRIRQQLTNQLKNLWNALPTIKKKNTTNSEPETVNDK